MEYVVDYLIDIEHSHWQESGRCKQHIYRYLRTMQEALKRQ